MRQITQPVLWPGRSANLECVDRCRVGSGDDLAVRHDNLARGPQTQSIQRRFTVEHDKAAAGSFTQSEIEPHHLGRRGRHQFEAAAHLVR
jgi:hypothetical protein